jgi:hypothetical protein
MPFYQAFTLYKMMLWHKNWAKNKKHGTTGFTFTEHAAIG